jgi:hypothetical protein
MADVSIYFGWKSMERLTSAPSLKDAGFSILGLLGAPLVGYLFGNIINGLIPTPSTAPIQLIPEITPFTYSPPSLTIETPTEKPYPSIGEPLKPIGYFSGINEVSTPIKLSYDIDIARQQSKNLSINLIFDMDGAQSKDLSVALIYEVELTT